MSESSASATSAETLRASTIVRPSASAARGAREEDHALSVTRNLGEGANHHRLTVAVLVRQRDGGPQSFVQLAAELRHQPLLILRKLDISLRNENLAMTRFHTKKAHRQIMPDRWRAAAPVPCCSRPLVRTPARARPAAPGPPSCPLERGPQRPGRPHARSSAARGTRAPAAVRAARAV